MNNIFSILEQLTIPDILLLIFIVMIVKTMFTIDLIMKDRDL
jgi:hypothetical protein